MNLYSEQLQFNLIMLKAAYRVLKLLNFRSCSQRFVTLLIKTVTGLCCPNLPSSAELHLQRKKINK